MDFCNAIANRRVIRFTYDNMERIVQPAAYGNHATTGGPKLRGYQTGGATTSGPLPEWRFFSIEKIHDLEILEDTFSEDPPGYVRGDKHLIVICEL